MSRAGPCIYADIPNSLDQGAEIASWLITNPSDHCQYFSGRDYPQETHGDIRTCAGTKAGAHELPHAHLSLPMFRFRFEHLVA